MPNPAIPFPPPQVPQTTVTYFPNIGLNGQLADTGHHDITTAVAESPGFDIGLAVAQGAGGYGYGRALSASTDITNGLVIGWSLYKAMQEPAFPHWQPTFAADIVRKGRIYVYCQGATVDNGPAFVIYSGANAGQLRGDAGAGPNAALQVPRVIVRQGAAAQGIALLDINLP